MLKFNRHFRMLRLCLCLISWFLVNSCTIFRNGDNVGNLSKPYVLTVEVWPDGAKAGLISILADAGLAPELIDQMDKNDFNSKPEIFRIRIHLYDKSQWNATKSILLDSGINLQNMSLQSE
jgi:hypothetical protein